MNKWRALVIAAGVAAASCGWASAADLLPPAPSLPPAPAAEFGGWYLRGDVGFGLAAGAPELQNAPNPIVAGVARGFLSSAAHQSFNNTSLSSSGMIDFGLGYQFNSWFRLDGTLEYRGGANLQLLYTLIDPITPTFGGPTQFADFYRANVSSFVGLVNGYVHLGTWYGVSPFVGAGVGFAENNVFGFTDQGVNYGDFIDLGPSGGYFSNGAKTNFAWALMAGLDFNITSNLKLEMGYRYLNYGKISTGGSHCLAGSVGVNCSGGVANLISSQNRLASNDFRLGLIYMLDDPAEPPPAPIMTRD